MFVFFSPPRWGLLGCLRSSFKCQIADVRSNARMNVIRRQKECQRRRQKGCQIIKISDYQKACQLKCQTRREKAISDKMSEGMSDKKSEGLWAWVGPSGLIQTKLCTTELVAEGRCNAWKCDMYASVTVSRLRVGLLSQDMLDIVSIHYIYIPWGRSLEVKSFAVNYCICFCLWESKERSSISWKSRGGANIRGSPSTGLFTKRRS